MASFTSTLSVSSSLASSEDFAAAEMFSAMVSPRLVISAVSVCCSCRMRKALTRVTASTTSAVMRRLSFTFRERRRPRRAGMGVGAVFGVDVA